MSIITEAIKRLESLSADLYGNDEKGFAKEVDDIADLLNPPAPLDALSVPTIHLNGTATCDLLEALATAHGALRAAHSALTETAPNGRDYYVQDLCTKSGEVPSAYEKARGEYRARLLAVERVMAELIHIGEKIQMQGKDRP